MSIILTFLLVAGASFAGGAAMGFLFGLPRAEKYRFLKKEEADPTAKGSSYGDNTNLEEVSDWLTKIIVGLTLIKLNTIIGWIDKAAHSINRVFVSGCDKCPVLNGYVFGYCAIILYFLAGAGLCYLWARTNLSVILTKSKREQTELEKKQLVTTVQKLTNLNLQTPEGTATVLKGSFHGEGDARVFPTVSFKTITESVYNAKPVYNPEDLQSDRWGGESKKGDYILEGRFLGESLTPGVYRIELSVRSLNTDNPLKGEAAFFLHDTFPSEIVYTVASNNKAEITFNAYEAFVAGARLENRTELELDLNKVKGFPEGFYWKE